MRRLLMLALVAASLTAVCAAAGADSGWTTSDRLTRNTAEMVQPRMTEAEMQYRQYLAANQQAHYNELNRQQFQAAQGRVAVSCPEKTLGLTIPPMHVKYWKTLPLTHSLQWTANDRVMCVPMKLRGALDPIIAKLLKNLKTDPTTNPMLERDPTLHPTTEAEAASVHRWIAESDRADEYAEAQQQQQFADERDFDSDSDDSESMSEEFDTDAFDTAQRGGRGGGRGGGGRGIGGRGIGGRGIGRGGFGRGGFGRGGFGRGGFGRGGFGRGRGFGRGFGRGGFGWGGWGGYGGWGYPGWGYGGYGGDFVEPIVVEPVVEPVVVGDGGFGGVGFDEGF